jgi:hypothetical protein
MSKSEVALIDVSEDASNSEGVNVENMLLCGVVFPATMTGTTITFDYAVDNSSWVDVFETDGTEVSYSVSAGNVVRIDPSGWAFEELHLTAQKLLTEKLNYYLELLRSKHGFVTYS